MKENNDDGLYLTDNKKAVIRYAGNEKKVVIPEGVEYICNLAFDLGWNNIEYNVDLSQIEEIILPKTLIGIGELGFSGCDFEKIDLPESLESIEYGAFNGCDKLKSIFIPKNVYNIEDKVFEYCGSLESINVDKDNPYFASYKGILYNKDMTELIACPGGILSVELPNTLKIINKFGFYCCTEIKKIVIPNSVTTIEGYAFDTCESLEEIKLPENLEEISEDLFSGCKKLKEIFIPKNTGWIDGDAFDGCENLVSFEVDKENPYSFSANGMIFNENNTLIKAPTGIVSADIPDVCLKIGRDAFKDCEKLKSVKIPESVEKIDSNAFYYCKNLSSFVVDDNNPFFKSLDGAVYSRDLSELVICPKNITSFNIPKTVKKIRGSAFTDCNKIREISIPKNVEEIEGNAFLDSGIKSIKISKNHPYLELHRGVLYNRDMTELKTCFKEVKTFRVPNTVKVINSGAFGNCSELRKLIISESVETIEDSAFASRLESITVNKNNLYKSRKGVLYNKDITELIMCPCRIFSLNIPKTVKKIGSDAFWYSNIFHIIVPKSVKIIEDGAFDCHTLSSIKLPKGFELDLSRTGLPKDCEIEYY